MQELIGIWLGESPSKRTRVDWSVLIPISSGVGVTRRGKLERNEMIRKELCETHIGKERFPFRSLPRRPPEEMMGITPSWIPGFLRGSLSWIPERITFPITAHFRFTIGCSNHNKTSRDRQNISRSDRENEEDEHG
jgi:hypothetical protein